MLTMNVSQVEHRAIIKYEEELYDVFTSRSYLIFLAMPDGHSLKLNKRSNNIANVILNRTLQLYFRYFFSSKIKF